MSCFCVLFSFFLIIRPPPRSTRTDTLVPFPPLFRSSCFQEAVRCCAPGGTAGPRPPPDGVTAMAMPDAYRRNFATLRRAAENGDLALMECTDARSEEHTSELQSLMRISYAVFCLKKKNYNKKT